MCEYQGVFLSGDGNEADVSITPYQKALIHVKRDQRNDVGRYLYRRKPRRSFSLCQHVVIFVRELTQQTLGKGRRFLYSFLFIFTCLPLRFLLKKSQRQYRSCPQILMPTERFYFSKKEDTSKHAILFIEYSKLIIYSPEGKILN